MPRKPRKSPPKAQVLDQQTENAESLQRIPIITHASGSTGLGLPDAKATAIAACLAQGFSVNRISKELGASHHTITALARNRPELVDQHREITRRNWQAVAMLATSELIDRVPNMKDQGLAVAAAIATEKMELLGGNATARIEHASRPAAEEWAEMLASLPANVQARAAQTGDVVEGVAVLMGNTSQPDAAKGQQDPSNGLSRHIQSSDSGPTDRDKAALVSGLVSIPAIDPPIPPGPDDGGAGVASLCSSIDPYSTEDAAFFCKSDSPTATSDKPATY
jgi:hypothetical protein